MIRQRSGLWISVVMLAVLAGAPASHAASPDPLYFNSSEPGCDGSDPNVLLCDDFEDRTWYASDAATSGGWLSPANSGWAGTTTANPITPAGAAVCSNQGAAGTNCAATHGQTTGGPGGRNMADHNFVNSQGVEELYVRYYTKPEAGYQFGAERVLTVNDGLPGGGGSKYGNLQFNCGVTGPSAAGNLQIQLPAPENVCTPITTLQSGRWYYIETHIKLNTPGQADGVLEVWVNDCGANGVCADSPILQLQRGDVRYDRKSTGELIRVLWWENRANPGSIGTRLIDQIKVSTAGPVGFVGSAAAAGAAQGSASVSALAAAAPAAISNIAAGSVTASQATITWTTSVPADSLIEYGPTAAYGSAAGDGALTTQHSVTLTGLAPGTLYHYRVQSSDAAGSLAMSGDQTFTVSGTVALSAMAAVATPGFSVSVSPAQTTAGGTIDVSWTALAGQTTSNDWLGLYAAGAPNETYLGYQYTGGLAAGALTFTLPDQPGDYEIRYLLDNGYTAVASSNPVTAAGGGSGGGTGGGGGGIAGFGLTASPSTVAPGESVTFTWTAPAGQASGADWIGLFVQGAANTDYLAYQYADGSSAGSIVLTAPDTDGVYEARYLLNNGYTDAASSNPVTVGAGGGSAGGGGGGGTGGSTGGGGGPTESSLTMGADPMNIPAGAAASLNWNGTGVTGCVASGGWTGAKAASGTQSVAPGATTTYTLTCQATGGGTVTQSATITVASGGGGGGSGSSLNFTANPVTMTAGSQALLTWTSAQVSNCTASGGWSGAKPANGTQLVSPTATTTYTLACQEAAGGTVTKSATITIVSGGGAGFSLTVSPASIPIGGDVTVAWTVPAPSAGEIDLIMFVPVGAGDQAPPLGVISTGGSTTGSVVFTTPFQLGTFEFRLMRNVVKMATSNPLTIIDTLAPAAEMLSPANGITVSKTIILEGFASDFFGIASVQFHVDGKPLTGAVMPLGEDEYAASWDTLTVPDGNHTLTFVSRDTAGNQTVSAPVTVRVLNDTIPPNVSIATPADGSTVKKTITVSVNATDNVGVVLVELALDGTVVSTFTAAPYQYAWDTLTVPDGTHTIKATASDAAGNSASKTSTFTVKNIDTTPPTVTITSPAAGATVSGSVTITANASDDDAVAGVRFFADGADLGEDTTAPYTATWDAGTAGIGSQTTHALSAVATDPSGNQATGTASVLIAGGTVALTLSPSTVAPFDSFAVNWSVSGGTAGDSDWVGLFASGADAENSMDYRYVGAGTGGSVSFTAPGAPGSYEVRYFPNGGYASVAAKPLTVSTGGSTGGGTVGGGGAGGTVTYTLTATPASVSPFGTITAAWTASGAGATDSDWIGLYEAGAAGTTYLDYRYAGTGASGSVTFTAPGTPGNYEIRFLPNFGYVSAASDTVTVASGGSPATPSGGGTVTYTLTATPASVSPFGTITVAWTASGAGAGSGDWIGLFTSGAAAQNSMDYRYIGAGTSGSVSFSAPGAPGAYDVRIFPDNGYTAAASASVTVAAVGIATTAGASSASTIQTVASPALTTTVTPAASTTLTMSSATSSAVSSTTSAPVAASATPPITTSTSPPATTSTAEQAAPPPDAGTAATGAAAPPAAPLTIVSGVYNLGYEIIVTGAVTGTPSRPYIPIFPEAPPGQTPIFDNVNLTPQSSSPTFQWKQVGWAPPTAEAIAAYEARREEFYRPYLEPFQILLRIPIVLEPPLQQTPVFDNVNVTPSNESPTFQWIQVGWAPPTAEAIAAWKARREQYIQSIVDQIDTLTWELLNALTPAQVPYALDAGHLTSGEAQVLLQGGTLPQAHSALPSGIPPLPPLTPALAPGQTSEQALKQFHDTYVAFAASLTLSQTSQFKNLSVVQVNVLLAVEKLMNEQVSGLTAVGLLPRVTALSVELIQQAQAAEAAAGAAPDASSPGGGDAGDPAGGNTSGITGLNASLIGSGVSFLGNAFTGSFLGVGITGAGIGIGITGFSSLSDAQGNPVAFVSTPIANMTLAELSLAALGVQSGSFVGINMGLAAQAASVNATSDDPTDAAAVPQGFVVSPTSPNMGAAPIGYGYNGIGIPSSFGPPATGATTGNPSPNSTDFGDSPSNSSDGVAAGSTGAGPGGGSDAADGGQSP